MDAASLATLLKQTLDPELREQATHPACGWGGGGGSTSCGHTRGVPPSHPRAVGCTHPAVAAATHAPPHRRRTPSAVVCGLRHPVAPLQLRHSLAG